MRALCKRDMKQSDWRPKNLAGCLQSEDQPYELLSCVRDGDIVMLALSPLPDEIGGKGRFPDADISCGVKKSVSQIA